MLKSFYSCLNYPSSVFFVCFNCIKSLNSHVFLYNLAFKFLTIFFNCAPRTRRRFSAVLGESHVITRKMAQKYCVVLIFPRAGTKTIEIIKYFIIIMYAFGTAHVVRFVYSNKTLCSHRLNYVYIYNN